MQQDHVSKRETPLGRWLPLGYYLLHLALWVVTGIQAGAWDLLWLGVLPLPALGIYVLCIRRKSA